MWHCHQVRKVHQEILEQLVIRDMQDQLDQEDKEDRKEPEDRQVSVAVDQSRLDSLDTRDQ